MSADLRTVRHINGVPVGQRENMRHSLMCRFRIIDGNDPSRCNRVCPALRMHPEPWCTWYYHGVDGEELRRHSFCRDDAPPLTHTEVGAITRKLKVDSFMNGVPPQWFARLMGGFVIGCGVALVAMVAIVLLVNP